MPFIRRVGRPGLLGTMARTAVVAGTATAVSGAVTNRQHQRAVAEQESAAYEQQQAAAAQQAAFAAAPPATPVPPAPAADGSDVLAKLQQLGQLHQQGILTDAEFAQAKALILGG